MQYLSARAASSAMVRQTLERRAARRLCVRSLDQSTKTLIETAIAELTGLGLVDDAAFARTRAASLAGRGLSKRRIELGLKRKGLARADIEQTLVASLDELSQARRFVQRKRLGHCRTGPQSNETRARDLRALARAGFNYGVSIKALEPADD
jgi:regulatory protein